MDPPRALLLMHGTLLKSIQRGTTNGLSDAKSDTMPHEISPPLTRRAIRRKKALKQTSESLHGLGLKHWLRRGIAESTDSRDREDSTSDKRIRTANSVEMAISHGRPLDTTYGPAACSNNAAGQDKRRCASAVSDSTDALSGYESAHLKWSKLIMRCLCR